LKLEERYSEDLLDGYLKEYNIKGDLIRTEKWVMGVLQKNAKELVKLDIKKTFYDDGKVKSQGSSKNGVLEGVMRFYDETGNISSSKIYKNGDVIGEGIYDEKGLQQGPWKEYYQTGEIKSEGVYENGRKIGLWKFFHQNGKMEQTGKYIKGKPDGAWKWFYESGNVLRTETFVKGLPDDEMIEYLDSGKVVTKGKFVDGEKEGFWVLEDGDEREEGEYKAGQKYGVWKTYYVENNKLAREGEFNADLEVGKHVWFYTNGNKNEMGNYVSGQKDGNWYHWDNNGLLIIVSTYVLGKETKVDGIDLPTKDIDVSTNTNE
jgi:uncharacterized protein